MADDGITKGNLAKLAKLLEAQEQILARLHDCNREMLNIIGGKASMGETLKRLEKAFDVAWGARYARGSAGAYTWSFARDRKEWMRLLRYNTPEELEARILRYIRSDERFFVEARHSFALFGRSVNQWAEKGDAAADLELDAEGPPDCNHKPRCKSDAEHTKRRGAEMRQ